MYLVFAAGLVLLAAPVPAAGEEEEDPSVTRSPDALEYPDESLAAALDDPVRPAREVAAGSRTVEGPDSHVAAVENSPGNTTARSAGSVQRRPDSISPMNSPGRASSDPRSPAESSHAPELPGSPVELDGAGGAKLAERRNQLREIEEGAEYEKLLERVLDGQTEYRTFQLEEDQVPSDYSKVLEQERVQLLRRQAFLAARAKEYSLAERYYLQALILPLRDEQRRDILLEMASMYDRAGIRLKHVAVLEKFIQIFPNDYEMPKIHLRLGMIYREMGAYKMALARFYNVLNATLSVRPEDVPRYREMAQRAQMEIAETHYQRGEYPEAVRFFERLMLLDLTQEERAEVHFKSAYTRYLLEEYANVVALLDSFVLKHPESILVPESHYLLANSLYQLDRPKDAVAEVLKLLANDQLKRPGNESIWNYWQKKTGNHLGNDFYENGDFMSALRIYQAMARLGSGADWQWPVIYQIGLCFERLRMTPKAINAYRLLVESEEWDGKPLDLNENLRSIREMANWRLEHLGWQIETNQDLNQIYNKVSATASRLNGNER